MEKKTNKLNRTSARRYVQNTKFHQKHLRITHAAISNFLSGLNSVKLRFVFGIWIYKLNASRQRNANVENEQDREGEEHENCGTHLQVAQIQIEIKSKHNFLNCEWILVNFETHTRRRTTTFISKLRERESEPFAYQTNSALKSWLARCLHTK